MLGNIDRLAQAYRSPQIVQRKIMAEGMNFGLKKRNTEGNSESRAPKVVVQGGQTPQILLPMAKQLLNVSRQVAVLRANVLSHYMLRKDMIWIEPMLEAHQKYVQKQQTMPEGDKWKADPIRVDTNTHTHTHTHAQAHTAHTNTHAKTRTHTTHTHADTQTHTHSIAKGTHFEDS